MSAVTKSCISDAQIQFVSLVDKAANKKQFLIAKSDDGKAVFSAYGKIVKTDSGSHYVTGIVYEPMVEDSQGDYMTEEEIRKAAHWFAKNGSGIDIQHNFEKLKNAEVVESWIAKSDFEIGNEKIKKGTWLMTVEITDPDVWSAVEKGEITGFSMGGRGVCNEKSNDINKKGFWKAMFNKMNLKKGTVADEFGKAAKSALFWQSFEVLKRALSKYDPNLGTDVFESDEETIKTALADFTGIVQGILTEPDITAVISASSPVAKAGKKNDGNDTITLQSIYDMLKKLADKAGAADAPDETVKKAQYEEYIRQTAAEAVCKAIEPLYKARGIATNLNDEPETISKSDDTFAGLFV